MPRQATPTRVVVRAYQVGFGDCFLLSVFYDDRPRMRPRRVLIDFGTTALPRHAGRVSLKDIAQHIHDTCGGRLDAVVATHRHQDHISGFRGGAGTIIAGMRPKVVLQPWTEDPEARVDATRPTRVTRRRQAHVRGLANMQQVAAAALGEIRARPQGMSRTVRDQLTFLGEDNIANKAAVQTLMSMGERNVYAHYGSRSGLERLLPGVTTHVLGPPTLEQSDAIRSQRSRDVDEFWHLQARAGRHAVGTTRLFPQAPRARQGALPFETRWLLPRMNAVRSEQVLEIVRVLDDEMNNTSLILLFEIGNKTLLFSGDAQIENWEYCLTTADDRDRKLDLLRNVDFYKVGHHGSLNATPKTLWRLFSKKGPADGSERMSSVMSTMSDKHGSRDRNTEVPRGTLKKALQENTEFFTTQTLRARNAFFEDTELLTR